MAQKDYYQILGVERNASDDVIKKAYKKLAVQYHPDKQVGKSDEEKKASEEKFKDINEAYSVLSDKDKRQHYDMFGTAEGGFGSGGMSAEDAMREFMRHMNMGFDMDSFFGGGSNVRESRGSDIQVNVNLSFEDLFIKRRKKIEYSRYEKCADCNGTGSSDGKTAQCPYCHGSGKSETTMRRGFSVIRQITVCPHCNGEGVIISSPCMKCGGKGVVRKNATYEFNIPNGATTNTYFDVANMGNAPERVDGVNGSLRVMFNVVPSNGFSLSRTDAYDLEYILEVPVLDCLTGCERRFKHVDGNEYSVSIRPGITNGHQIRMRNLGLYRNDGSRGFLNIYIKEKMPSSLTKEERKIIDKLKSSKSFK